MTLRNHLNHFRARSERLTSKPNKKNFKTYTKWQFTTCSTDKSWTLNILPKNAYLNGCVLKQEVTVLRFSSSIIGSLKKIKFSMLWFSPCVLSTSWHISNVSINIVNGHLCWHDYLWSFNGFMATQTVVKLSLLRWLCNTPNPQSTCIKLVSSKL